MKKSHTGSSDKFSVIFSKSSMKQRKPFLNCLRIGFFKASLGSYNKACLLFTVIPLIIIFTHVLVINNTTDMIP